MRNVKYRVYRIVSHTLVVVYVVVYPVLKGNHKFHEKIYTSFDTQVLTLYIGC